MERGDDPDPTYREIFIPQLGDYDYDAAAEEFVLTGAAPPSEPYTPLIAMALMVGMFAIIIPGMEEI